jgi:hypothetical protein
VKKKTKKNKALDYRMLYYCHWCGWRMSQRQNVPQALIGTHVFYDQRRFCASYCVDAWKQNFKGNRVKPEYPSAADWDEADWKAERKRTRKPRPKPK